MGRTDYRLEELLDVPRLQELFESLNDAFPFPSAIIDNESNVLTATAWQDVCTKFHRVNEASELECRESDRYILGHLDEDSPSVVYRCPHGMVDAATPIWVGDAHLGNVFVGQLFLEPPDVAFFRAQAARYGFDEQEYLEAVARVPVLTESQLDRYLAVMRKFAEVLGTMALERLKEKQANDEVREAGEFNRQVIADAQEGIVVYGCDGRIKVWNPFMEELSGTRAGEVLGRSAHRDFPLPSWGGVSERIEETLRNGAGEAAEFGFDAAAFGVSGWVSARMAPLRSVTGEVVGVIETVRDVTERLRGEQSLRDADARLRRAQRMANVGSWELDLATRTVWASEEAFSVYGLRGAGPMLTLDAVQDRVLPKHRERLDEALRRLVADGREYDVEFEIRREDDGQLRVLHSVAEVVRGADGAAAGVLGAVQDVTELKAAERTALDSAARLRRTVDGTLKAMGSVVETRDPYTAGHQRRVTELAVVLGARMGVRAESLRTLRLACEVHDIGKISVPAEILTRPGRLSEAELSLIRLHPALGGDILAKVDFDLPVEDVVRRHHERLDGSGYPDGLCADSIPLEARILAVADVVEAMSSHRPYRPALGIEAALDEVRRGAGLQYDAEVVAVCVQAFAGGFDFGG